VSLRDISSDVYDGRTVWELPCEVPYCFMQYRRGVASFMHSMAVCPVMRTAVGRYGDQNGQPKPLKTDMRCVACRCGVGILDEDYDEDKKCEHCLEVCYCSQRTFEEVGHVMTRDGIRVMKVSDMEKILGSDGQFVKMTMEELSQRPSKLKVNEEGTEEA